MSYPNPVFEVEYKHDRRTHRHRCLHCNRCLDTGDRALMVRISKKTRAVHIECAEMLHGNGPWTVRDAMTCWGVQHQRALGYKVPQHPMKLAR